MKNAAIWWSLWCVPLALWADEQPKLEAPPVAEGFEQLIPRGGIPALVDPEFVTAEAADLPDTAWVLGFVSDGEAYAYDLNLLNSHEIVNHKVGERGIAAVW